MSDAKTFSLVIRDGLFGAVVGLFAGMILSIVIYAVLVLSDVILGSAHTNDAVPAQLVLMMGMGWGAVLGGIFGGITALKK